MSIRTSFGLSKSKNIAQTQQQPTTYAEHRITQPSPGYSNLQYRGTSNITNTTGQTYGNNYNNPSMANNNLPTLQQNTKWGYKP